MILKSLVKCFFAVVKYILFGIAFVALFIGIGATVSAIQSKVFVPDEFILWAIPDSVPMMVNFILLLVLTIFYYIKIKGLKIEDEPIFKDTSREKWIKEHKGISIAVCLVFLAIIVYFIFVNVAIVFSDKIVMHSFLRSYGKTFVYSDIDTIRTGIYGNTTPFVHSKGEFYYIVELDDGTEFNLANVGGTVNNKDFYQTLEEIDKGFVKHGIPKKADSRHFNLIEESLDKVYSDRIKNILEIINLHYGAFRILLPEGWMIKTENTSSVNFINDQGQQLGGAMVTAYYADEVGHRWQPNHSSEIGKETINTSFGKGELIVLERDYPAASGKKEVWKEIHAVIPVKNQDLAFDFCLKVNKSLDEDKSLLKKILAETKQIH